MLYNLHVLVVFSYLISVKFTESFDDKLFTVPITVEVIDLLWDKMTDLAWIHPEKVFFAPMAVTILAETKAWPFREWRQPI